MTYIGKNIKMLRTEKEMSQQEFGDLFDISRASVGSYEEGRAEPKIETLLKMSRYFSLSIDALLTKNITAKNKETFEVSTEQVRPAAPQLYLEQRIEELERKMEKIAKIININ